MKYRLMRSDLYPSARTKRRNPCASYVFMMCHRTGRPPMSTRGLGSRSLTSRIRVPMPPHRITTGMSRGSR